MKQALAILVVIAFVAALSSAATYHPTKDTFWRYDDGSPAGITNYGAANEQRAGKGWQDGFFMDFDRAAILADASAALGHTATAADFTSGTVTVTLKLMAGDWGGFTHTASYTPAYFTSSTDWTESGASYLYADNATLTKWNGGGGNNNLRDCAVIQNSGAAQVWAAGDDVYQTFTIPADIATGFLFATAPGVAIEMYGSDWSNNGACFAKEGKWVDGQTYAGPVLTVTAPEPCSMLLIAAGAVATLARRRK